MSKPSPPLQGATRRGERPSASIVRFVVLLVVVAGWVASIVLLRRVGGRNPSVLLQGLFVGWVSSPFICLALANLGSKHWASPNRVRLHVVSLLISAGAMAAYGGAVSLPRGSRPAFAYLMVPLASWALLAILAAASAILGARTPPCHHGAAQQGDEADER